MSRPPEMDDAQAEVLAAMAMLVERENRLAYGPGWQGRVSVAEAAFLGLMEAWELYEPGGEG